MNDLLPRLNEHAFSAHSELAFDIDFGKHAFLVCPTRMYFNVYGSPAFMETANDMTTNTVSWDTDDRNLPFEQASP